MSAKMLRSLLLKNIKPTINWASVMRQDDKLEILALVAPTPDALYHALTTGNKALVRHVVRRVPTITEKARIARAAILHGFDSVVRHYAITSGDLTERDSGELLRDLVRANDFATYTKYKGWFGNKECGVEAINRESSVAFIMDILAECSPTAHKSALYYALYTKNFELYEAVKTITGEVVNKEMFNAALSSGDSKIVNMMSRSLPDTEYATIISYGIESCDDSLFIDMFDSCRNKEPVLHAMLYVSLLYNKIPLFKRMIIRLSSMTPSLFNSLFQVCDKARLKLLLKYKGEFKVTFTSLSCVMGVQSRVLLEFTYDEFSDAEKCALLVKASQFGNAVVFNKFNACIAQCVGQCMEAAITNNRTRIAKALLERFDCDCPERMLPHATKSGNAELVRMLYSQFTKKLALIAFDSGDVDTLNYILNKIG